MEKDIRDVGSSFGDVIRQELAKELGDSIYQNFLPAFSFVREKRSERNWFAEKQITDIMPLYGYSEEQRLLQMEDEMLSLDEILLTEAEERVTQNQAKESLQGTENSQELGITQEPENPQESSNSQQTGNAQGTGIPQATPMVDESLIQQEMSLEELLKAENEAAILAREAELQAAKAFVPHQIQAQVDLEELKSYETLVSEFYTIDANTMAGSDQLNVEKLLSYDMTVSKEDEGPQILIYHTHSQETFADSVPGDTSTSIIGVGARLGEILTEKYGYEVLHHTGEYDVETRDDAYSVSLPAIEQLLAENPSIQVVVDLHRDQMPEETKLVMDLDGRPTARFMLFNGLSRTKKTGNISYLYNEYQEENLAFSFQMQLRAAEYYPGLTRKIYLKGYRYNMHLKPKTLLIELGAQNNTVEEAMNACDPLAHILDMVLSGQ